MNTHTYIFYLYSGYTCDLNGNQIKSLNVAINSCVETFFTITFYKVVEQLSIFE